MPANPPLAASPRYHLLDAWRGIACLMIVVLHASFYGRYGFHSEADRLDSPFGSRLLLIVTRFGIGVQLFFVISGYCIAAAADANRRAGVDVRQYFIRRFRRIFPPYWVAVVLTAIAAALAPSLFNDSDSPIPPPGDLTWQQWIGNLTLTETWRPHVTPDPYQLQLGPAWSLCYEEQFYAVCGLLLFLVPRHFFRGILATSAVTVVLVWIGKGRTWSELDYVFLDGRWLLFAAGVFVYYIRVHTTGTRKTLCLAAYALLPVTALVARYYFLPGVASPANLERLFEFVAGLGFGFGLLLLHPFDERLKSARFLQPLNWCGRMCYSLYLIHWPITKAISHGLADLGFTSIWGTLGVTIPVCIVASLAAARVFYLVFERPFLNRPISIDGRSQLHEKAEVRPDRVESLGMEAKNCPPVSVVV